MHVVVVDYFIRVEDPRTVMLCNDFTMRLRPLWLTVDKGRYELGTKDHVLKPMEFGLQCWQRHEHELVRGLLPRV